MKPTTRIIAVLGLMSGCVAFAQVAEFGVTGGASLLRNNSLVPVELGDGTSADTKLADGFRLGFRITLNTYRFFGHEVGYAYNRTQLKIENVEDFGMAIHQGFYNFLAYALPEGAPVRPFATAGAHFANFVPPGASATSGGGDTNFGLNYGGGIKARLGPKFIIRFDVRQYHTPKPDFFVQAPTGWLRQTEVSAGFGIGI